MGLHSLCESQLLTSSCPIFLRTGQREERDYDVSLRFPRPLFVGSRYLGKTLHSRSRWLVWRRLLKEGGLEWQPSVG